MQPYNELWAYSSGSLVPSPAYTSSFPSGLFVPKTVWFLLSCHRHIHDFFFLIYKVYDPQTRENTVVWEDLIQLLLLSPVASGFLPTAWLPSSLGLKQSASCVWITFWVQPSADRQQGRFHNAAVMAIGAISTDMQVSLWHAALEPFGQMPRSGVPESHRRSTFSSFGNLQADLRIG